MEHDTTRSPLQPFLRPDEVASMLGVSLDTVKRWRVAGEGPPAVYLTPRTVRYQREAVEAWANRGVRAPSSVSQDGGP